MILDQNSLGGLPRAVGTSMFGFATSNSAIVTKLRRHRTNDWHFSRAHEAGAATMSMQDPSPPLFPAHPPHKRRGAPALRRDVPCVARHSAPASALNDGVRSRGRASEGQRVCVVLAIVVPMSGFEDTWSTLQSLMQGSRTSRCGHLSAARRWASCPGSSIFKPPGGVKRPIKQTSLEDGAHLGALMTGSLDDHSVVMPELPMRANLLIRLRRLARNVCGHRRPRHSADACLAVARVRRGGWPHPGLRTVLDLWTTSARMHYGERTRCMLRCVVESELDAVAH